MTELSEFLLARIAEDETVARAATPGPWDAAGESVESATPDGWPAIMHASFEDGGELNAAHIARHDPARVLAECQAKRQIVEVCRGQEEQGPGEACLSDIVLCALAVVYAGHEDYRKAWKP